MRYVRPVYGNAGDVVRPDNLIRSRDHLGALYVIRPGNLLDAGDVFGTCNLRANHLSAAHVVGTGDLWTTRDVRTDLESRRRRPRRQWCQQRASQQRWGCNVRGRRGR